MAVLGASADVSNAANLKSSHLLGWLIHLGGVGVFALAIVDSSVIPIPLPASTDMLLLLLTSFHSKSIAFPITYATAALAGSLIGGYLTWAAGKKGGEAALDKLGRGRFIRKIQGWVRKHGMLSVAVAALLPPPIPLMPFLLAAGALGLSVGRFLPSYGIGRAIRYGVGAWLGFHYGRELLVLWQKNLSAWTAPIVTVYVILVLLGTAYGVRKYRKDRGTARNSGALAEQKRK